LRSAFAAALHGPTELSVLFQVSPRFLCTACLATRAASKRSNCKGPLGPPCAVTPEGRGRQQHPYRRLQRVNPQSPKNCRKRRSGSVPMRLATRVRALDRMLRILGRAIFPFECVPSNRSRSVGRYRRTNLLSRFDPYTLFTVDSWYQEYGMSFLIRRRWI
jgi:hypothetical protein